VDDPLAALVSFDRLEVGPVRVQPRRLFMPYRIVRGDWEDAVELIYRWEEPVFDTSSEDSRNMASLVGAQVALNYGLFCREIIFHGPFDPADREFLRDMAENTCREIYVKKFLEPNPFLVEGYRDLPVVERDRYLRAELRFPDGLSASAMRPAPMPEADPERYAVLSSGGKDSLLSYGLLEEAGFEVHPVFGNESGRHWYTALNAHRHFRRTVPSTARVWMNSDRVFAWMLRHLPFVRRDFAAVRSDEYPVRLWTVAVFLFGTLPLLRKRGVAYLVIGDEFDTTDRREHEGIEHYNGLFDQSLYFDATLNAYYRTKGWDLAQCSLLRPLSEILIEKTLTERYPALFEQQVSCHATHMEGERVRPCGRCEKCRRIVGMLVALGADPGRCGYSERQVADCLEALPRQGVAQEDEGAAHLLRLLERQGRIELEDGCGVRPEEHPEVMRLRFHPEASPVDCTPRASRGPVWKMLLEHAEGAVRRDGEDWVAFDPLTPESLGAPFPWEQVPEEPGPGPQPEGGARSWILGELNWPEARRRLREVDVALLPVGALEQHGPHLPLDTDAFDARHLAREVAARCADPKPLVLPLVPYGVSYHHEGFPGTVGVSNDALARLVYDIGMSLARNGIRKLLIVNGHGGNEPTLNHAAQMINRDARIFVCVDSGETSDRDVEALAETSADVHSGEIETSTSLALRPHLVRMDLAEALVPRFSSRYLNPDSRYSVPWHAFTNRLSPTGVMGDPTRATAEKGRRMWEVMIDHLVALVEDIKPLSLDEIYQKRY
jgi:creatinine amidohydrolase/Fe(II)-dependent formamide hydrolase-like protein